MILERIVLPLFLPDTIIHFSSRMMIVPTVENESENRFMAYITDDKVGLHFLPATGNPHLAMALIAHPTGVSRLSFFVFF